MRETDVRLDGDGYEETINGNTYVVSVDEEPGYRRVWVAHKESIEEKGHSYVLVDDRRRSKEGGLFSEGTSLPDRTTHISDAMNDAVAKLENNQSIKEEKRDDIEAVLGAAKEVWEE